MRSTIGTIEMPFASEAATNAEADFSDKLMLLQTPSANTGTPSHAKTYTDTTEMDSWFFCHLCISEANVFS